MLVQAWFMLFCPINTCGRLPNIWKQQTSQTFFFSFWDMSISRYRSVRLCSMQQAPNISSCLSIKVILLPLAVCQWILGLLCFGARIKSTLGSIWHLLSHKPKWYKAQYSLKALGNLYFALSSVCLKYPWYYEACVIGFGSCNAKAMSLLHSKLWQKQTHCQFWIQFSWAFSFSITFLMCYK